jgi:hypothetical protein
MAGSSIELPLPEPKLAALIRQTPKEPERVSQRLLRIISLGAGVQSTTMALMAAHGEIGPMPDCAIFADTGWEPKAVYEHLRWLMSPGVLPFPVHIVSAGSILNGILSAASGNRWASIPAYANTPDGVGQMRRQCTREYKIVPIRRKVREIAGIANKRSPKYPIVEQWIGISLDEAIRMKPSMEKWQVNRWPLIEQRMSRWDCELWLKRKGYAKAPKSACIGCPYHSDARWRDIRDNDPDAWAEAIEVDRKIRTGFRGMRHQIFLHRSCKPLDQADLTTAEDRGQLSLFMNECDGMCGV